MRSIQGRLMLIVGLGATLFWLAAAGLTADRLSREVRTLFDDDLRATAERILPLAAQGAKPWRKDREVEEGEVERRDHDDDHDDDTRGDLRGRTIYRVTDSGGVVLASKGTAVLPPAPPKGFSDTETHRLYTASGAGLTITVAAPLTGRAALVQALMLRLVLPLAVLLPLSLLGIAWAVRRGLRPLRDLRAAVGLRGVQDLSPLAPAGAAELQPITQALNGLFTRLDAGFQAERAFASHAAHELRTPVAGAIAQLQRLRAELPGAAPRVDEIEATLKRLMRTSEKLMQLARAEGGRITGEASDMRTALRIVVQDATRAGGEVRLALPDAPVLSVTLPDALGILARNLIENALRHGAAGVPVDVALTADGVLRVVNAGPVLDAKTLARLGQRFEKGEDSQGMGLGLAIVSTIAERSGANLRFLSPPEGRPDGLEVRVTLPR